jgi:lysophospholipase L1-like esterase
MTLSKRIILLNALVFITLGGSSFFNFLLYNQAKKYYFELNQTRLDPLGLSYYPANSKEVPRAQPSLVVFFGDSRAASWTAPNISGYEFINRGIDAQTSVQTIDRFSYHVRPLKPDVVIVQVGINDLKTIALFPERREPIVANCQANIKRIIEESKNLGAVVIVTTIFPVGNVPLVRKPFWSDEIDRSIKEVNAYIATLADDQTIVFDAFSILSNSQGLMLEKYGADELHLNEQGYVILNEKLVQLINSIKPKKAQT